MHPRNFLETVEPLGSYSKPAFLNKRLNVTLYSLVLGCFVPLPDNDHTARPVASNVTNLAPLGIPHIHGFQTTEHGNLLDTQPGFHHMPDGNSFRFYRWNLNGRGGISCDSLNNLSNNSFHNLTAWLMLDHRARINNNRLDHVIGIDGCNRLDEILAFANPVFQCRVRTLPPCIW
ncbi:hypothetical protein BMAGN_1421 [Bifidobacterium magnum]|uniref:Uncharacterized protein n=1 Tax=Bifidobacterium magnum TaxID=1692 RepID=A0A087B663_9BIFI|nr:hypothetical protein BMAGN_1421 [Bifidobacterium magnum]